MSDCSVVKTYANGESAEMEGALAMPLRINRCPLLGSTPWRHQIKLHDVFFSSRCQCHRLGTPGGPGNPGEEIHCCSGSSRYTPTPVHTSRIPENKSRLVSSSHSTLSLKTDRQASTIDAPNLWVREASHSPGSTPCLAVYPTESLF